MWSVHYRILLHKRAVNSSWGPAQEPDTQSPRSVWNYTESCMIKTWALPQDAQKFNQDIRPRWPTLQTRWLGAATGGPWAEPGASGLAEQEASGSCLGKSGCPCPRKPREGKGAHLMGRWRWRLCCTARFPGSPFRSKGHLQSTQLTSCSVRLVSQNSLWAGVTINLRLTVTHRLFYCWSHLM